MAADHHSLLVGTILHVLYAAPDKTLAGVANFLSDPKRPIETTGSLKRWGGVWPADGSCRMISAGILVQNWVMA